eukprot:6816242-Alexandrium_andersonii.AAC.1
MAVAVARACLGAASRLTHPPGGGSARCLAAAAYLNFLEECPECRPEAAPRLVELGSQLLGAGGGWRGAAEALRR